MQEDLINILIVDDHKLVRQGLVALMEKVCEFEIVGEVGNGSEAIDLLLKSKTHVILLDINMPLSDGIETLKKIRAMDIDVKIIILADYPNEKDMIRSIKYGANGFLVKNDNFKKMVEVIKDVNDNRGSLDLCRIKDKDVQEDINLKEKDIYKINLLSTREYEILELIASGNNNREIGKKLFLSEKTIKNHITSIYRKIKVVNRVEAVIFCYENKIN